MRTRAIIVGTDGTESSKAAVDWAAREARLRRLPLRIMHVFEWVWVDARYDIGGESLDFARGFAEAVSAAALDRARAVAPEIECTRDTVVGHATPELIAASQGAELMVLGHRGRGGFAGLGLGSVSQRVATHAKCPVVVVRGDGDFVEGPVVVGVDDSPAADHVLATAFEVAAGRGCALTVVRAYLPSIPPWLARVRAAEVETPEQDTAERARLEGDLAPWRDKYPDVPVEIMLTHDSAASALVGLSSRACLVIVGSHGHGVLAGALLGSAGLQLLHHASCPVYIVRHRSRRIGETAQPMV
ncbi:universal stress protein [Actinoplanes sp. NPDC049668]|uniref:universal stress protein n=1 Tax=unclassified Actinoplanes TaxID=2626549 RepID=UPI0033BEEC5F